MHQRPLRVSSLLDFKDFLVEKLCFEPLLSLCMYVVLDHTNHIFSESFSSGDDNDRDEYLQKRQIQRQRHTYIDKDKYKVLPRPNVCYIYQKQRVQGF